MDRIRQRLGGRQPKELPARKLLRPLERFVREEVSGALVLMVAAVAALAWRNVAPDSYEAWWTTASAVAVGSLELELDLREVVNELLMVVFFYVVTLEIKRETVHGRLRDRRYAVVPVAGAMGAMTGAALVYVALNVSGGELRGWAIPIATDIAFALGALGLLGGRAPPGLRTFLLTLAIVDDVVTIVIIALVFSAGISVAWLVAAFGAAVAVVFAQRLGLRSVSAYVILAAALWLATLESGVHATIAGVVLGLLTPARELYPREATGKILGEELVDMAEARDVELSEATMHDVSRLSHEAVSPLARLEAALHPWSAYVVLPIFALANAGIPVSIDRVVDVLSSQVGLGIVLGLLVGAPLGGLAAAFGVVRLTRARLPERLDWSSIAGVSPLKGIGFTVSIFLATLTFDEPGVLERSKLAILLGSTAAALLGIAALYGRHRHRGRREPTG